MKNEIIDVMIARQAYPHSSSTSEIPVESHRDTLTIRFPTKVLTINRPISKS